MRIARRKPAFLIALPESGVHAKIKKMIAMRSPPENHSEIIAKKNGAYAPSLKSECHRAQFFLSVT